ncbi:MAG: tetratricopeptide repeat protein [Hyphomonadaceae bacterium]|nr:tetratricopeptide repeat protein [Hyphomonadaceae bacterium]
MRAHWLWGTSLALALLACQREPDDPLAAARAACANAQSEAEARINGCTTLIESGALGEAERAEALANRGAAAEEAGDAESALGDFEAALALDAAQPLATLGRARVLVASGQLDAAQPLAQRLVQGGDYLSDAHQLIGAIALTRGQQDAAILAFDAAIQADGRNALALAGRARAKQQLGDFDGALTDFSTAISVNPQLAPAYAGRCWVRVQMPEPDLAAARRDGDEAAQLDPRGVQGQLCRGLLQLRAGEWEGARMSYEAALEVEPGNPAALFGRGVARRRSGDAQGRDDMNQARDFEANIGRTFEELGVQTF